HVGGEHARSAGAAGGLFRAGIGGRENRDADVRDQARAEGPEGRQRPGSSRAVRSRDGGSRQGTPVQRGGPPAPRQQGTDLRSEGKGGGQGFSGQGARRTGAVAVGGRERNLPGAPAERPGPLEFSDQVEQQDRGAAGHHRERRRAADRADLL